MRIYVSSTSEDLSSYRSAVVEQLERLGHAVVSMEGYSADARGPVDKCLADVASSEAYIGLFAFRYGTIPDGHTLSITEMEYQKATELSLPRLVFIVPDDVTNWAMNLVDKGEAGIRMERLRATLNAQDGFTAAHFTSKTELLTALPQAVKDLEVSPLQASHSASAGGDHYRSYAKPLSFEAEMTKHIPHFTGREWVDVKLDEWITRKQSSLVFCLVGGPGIGKSAIACHWCHSRDDVVAHHYCVHGHKEKTDPGRVLLSIVAQMANHIPEYEERLRDIDPKDLRDASNSDARAVFDTFLMKPLSGDMPAPARDRLIVIDGLDEASRDQHNELASFIGETWSGLPQWLRLVVTTRPELDVSGYLEHLHPFIMNAVSSENLQDVRTYLRNELDEMNADASDDAVNTIVDKSEGLFLYAKVVLDELRASRLSLDQLADFPEGMTGYYKRWFDRKFPDRDYYRDRLHELVSAIVAQQAPLPLDILSSALRLSSHELHQRLIVLGVLFPLREEHYGDQALTCVTLMHKSLHDWLTEQNPATLRPRAGQFAADLELGNRLLAEEGWEKYSDGNLTHHPYFSQTLLSHLAEAGKMKDLAQVLLDPDLLVDLWSGEYQFDWQRHISNLRHTLSLTRLVRDWVSEYCRGDAASVRIASAAGLLSRMFREVGAFEEAIVLARAALDLWQANDIMDSPDMVESLLVMGKVHFLRDQLDQANASYERALDIAKRAYAPDSKQIGDVYYDLCVFYHQGKRDYNKAWDALEKCLSIRTNSIPPDYVGMANCINDKAVIRSANGIPDDYLGMYREALSLFEKSCPKGHPEMVAILGNIANEHRIRGRQKEALPILRRAVKMADNILLPQQEYVGFAKSMLMNTLFALGRYEEALEIVHAHVAAHVRFPGPDHDDTAAAYSFMCGSLIQALSLSAEDKRSGIRHEIRNNCLQIKNARPATILNLLDHAEILRRTAETELSGIFTETVKRVGHNSMNRSSSTSSESTASRCYAEVLEALMSGEPLSEVTPRISNIWEGAEPLMRTEADCLAQTRKNVVSLVSWFADVGLFRDDDVDGIQAAYELIDGVGAENPETMDHLASLAISLHNRHHDEMSLSLCERLFKKSVRVLGPDHNQTVKYLEIMAHLQVHLNMLSEAELSWRKALAQHMEVNGHEQSSTLSALVGLVGCLIQNGDEENAAKMIRDHAATLSTSDEYASARTLLAKYLTSKGMDLKNEYSAFREAKTCYDLSLEVNAESSTTHNNMGLLLWVCLDDADTAVVHFRRAIELGPTDGVVQSNLGHMLAQTLNDPEQARTHFDRAMDIDPNSSATPGNYATMLLTVGEFDEAWKLAQRSMRLCRIYPSRIMARPLFCASAILLLQKKDASIPLGQLKGLFAHGIDHVSWFVTALLEVLDRELPADSSRLMRSLSHAIDDRSRIKDLEADLIWQSIEIVPFDMPWPSFD